MQENNTLQSSNLSINNQAIHVETQYTHIASGDYEN